MCETIWVQGYWLLARIIRIHVKMQVATLRVANVNIFVSIIL